MAIHNTIGAWGEEIAYEYFLKKGYSIVDRNVRLGKHLNEIDLIVQHGQRIIFVEVKTRSHDAIDPLTAITKDKQNRIIRAAEAYLTTKRPIYDPQFDIIIVVGDKDNYTIEHHEDVFLPTLRSL